MEVYLNSPDDPRGSYHLFRSEIGLAFSNLRFVVFATSSITNTTANRARCAAEVFRGPSLVVARMGRVRVVDTVCRGVDPKFLAKFPNLYEHRDSVSAK
jgi:hypothetical protein